MCRIPDSADARIVGARNIDDTFDGNIGIVRVELGGFEDTVNLVEELEKWVIVAITMRDVFDKVRHFDLIN